MTLAPRVIHHQGRILQDLALNSQIPEVELRSPPGEIEICKPWCTACEDETTRTVDRIAHIQSLANRSRRRNRRHGISRSAEVRVRQSQSLEPRARVQIKRRTGSRTGSTVRKRRRTGKA